MSMCKRSLVYARDGAGDFPGVMPEGDNHLSNCARARHRAGAEIAGDVEMHGAGDVSSDTSGSEFSTDVSHACSLKQHRPSFGGRVRYLADSAMLWT